MGLPYFATLNLSAAQPGWKIEEKGIPQELNAQDRSATACSFSLHPTTRAETIRISSELHIPPEHFQQDLSCIERQ